MCVFPEMPGTHNRTNKHTESTSFGVVNHLVHLKLKYCFKFRVTLLFTSAKYLDFVTVGKQTVVGLVGLLEFGSFVFGTMKETCVTCAKKTSWLRFQKQGQGIGFRLAKGWTKLGYCFQESQLLVLEKHPGKLTWNWNLKKSPICKGKSSSKPPFSCSMFVLYTPSFRDQWFGARPNIGSIIWDDSNSRFKLLMFHPWLHHLTSSAQIPTLRILGSQNWLNKNNLPPPKKVSYPILSMVPPCFMNLQFSSFCIHERVYTSMCFFLSLVSLVIEFGTLHAPLAPKMFFSHRWRFAVLHPSRGGNPWRADTGDLFLWQHSQLEMFDVLAAGRCVDV